MLDRPITHQVAPKALPIEIPEPAIQDFCQRHHIQVLALFGSVLRAEISKVPPFTSAQTSSTSMSPYQLQSPARVQIQAEGVEEVTAICGRLVPFRSTPAPPLRTRSHTDFLRVIGI